MAEDIKGFIGLGFSIDDLDGEDRMLLRKLIKYAEHLERELREADETIHRLISKGANYDD